MSNILTHSARALAVRFADWRARQRAYAELSALDDRDLADIGVSRSEIPYLLARGAERPVAPQPQRAAGRDYLHAA